MPPSHNTEQQAVAYHAWAVCGLLLLAIGLIYGQTLDHVLLDYDDNGFVYENRHVTQGLTGAAIRWAFTEGPYGEWYPLAPLSHMLDCQLFGLNAWGHHLTNVLLHAAASIALFLVLWRMTGELWPSAFVAAVFAVHPQHVESVAWVAERRDVLSGLFFMLTLAAWLGYVRHGRSPGRYLLTAALFALGLMAKPMLVTLPPLLLLLDFWPLGRFGSASDVPGWARSVERPGAMRLVLEKLPLFALSAGDCLVTLRTHGTGGVPGTWSERIGNAAVSCVGYVAGFFYPVDLAAFYPSPSGGPPQWKVAVAIAILAATSAAAVIWRRRCPYFFVGWFWYLGMLFPVLGLITVSDHAMADRYMYLPGIGLYIALAWGGWRIAAGSPAGRRTLAACAGVAIAVLVALAAWQTSFWRDDETLWRHALACTTANAKAETALANALVRQGRRDEALAYYHQAESHATDSWPYVNLGALLSWEGKLDEAVAEFRRGLEVDPDSFRAHLNLGIALDQQHQFDESLKHLRRAVEISPRDAKAHGSLAHLLLFNGKIDEARDALERTLALDPHNASARNDLGLTFFLQKKIDASIPHFEAALVVDPQFVQAHINLARALATRGQIDEALAHYRQALAMNPNDAMARQEFDLLLQVNAQRLRP